MRRQEFSIAGTHCASCEVLLERRLKQIPGVRKAKVSFGSGNARIESERVVSRKELANAVNRDGYRLRVSSESKSSAPGPKDYLEIGGLLIVFIALYLVFKRFDLLPSTAIADRVGLGTVFIIGLIAGTSTCLAVTGGLLLALAAKYSEANPDLSGVRKFKPTLYFNAGRVAGYTLFGAALGALGSLVSVSLTASGLLTVVAALIMILLGLQMLHIVPYLDRLSVRMPKAFTHLLYDTSGTVYGPWAPFTLGAFTFFVPCGFTQALQFFVLAQGNALFGGLTMGVFALGTLPMLTLIGAASSFTRGPAHRFFVRAAAVLVVLLGVLGLPAGVALLR